MSHWTVKVIGGYLDLEKQDFPRFIYSLNAKCIDMIPNMFTYVDYTIYPWTKMLLVIGISHGMPSASPFDSFAERTPPLFEIFYIWFLDEFERANVYT